VIVLLSNSGAIKPPWHKYPDAILEGYLFGEGRGAAVVALVFGCQSPCGILAETVTPDTSQFDKSLLNHSALVNMPYKFKTRETSHLDKS
jgi:hypothetical protein